MVESLQKQGAAGAETALLHQSNPALWWLQQLHEAINARDRQRVAALFLPDGCWRDHLALTWRLHTVSRPDEISAELVAIAPGRIHRFSVDDHACEVFEHRTRGETAESAFTFETDDLRARGHVRLIRDASRQWKAWTFFTSLEAIKGHEEQVGVHRPRRTHEHGMQVAGPRMDPNNPQALVIGAGHAGLMIAARLQALGIATRVVDREKRLGDNWRNRYQSLILHNGIAANHFPYLPFPATWPNYLSKDEIADWLEIYSRALGLDVQTLTTPETVSYDDSARRWTVVLRNASGARETIYPRHIVQATGVFGQENRPVLPGADGFSGRLLYATDYDATFEVAGLRALVIGTGSSGHDVAQDLCERGALVTMLQRSSTCVVSVEPGAARAYSIYADDGLPIEDADLVSNSFPFPVVVELHKEMTKKIAEMDRELLSGLERAGFATDFGEDASGFLMKYHRYGGGYYINVGASDLIVAGKIKVQQGTEVSGIEGHTVKFTNGQQIEADLIVIAAGYTNMSASVRAMMGEEVARRVGPVWGLDEEGEVRAMWRRTAQPGFWIMGGSLQQCRSYSKYLALQIKAQELGLLG